MAALLHKLFVIHADGCVGGNSGNGTRACNSDDEERIHTCNAQRPIRDGILCDSSVTDYCGASKTHCTEETASATDVVKSNEHTCSSAVSHTCTHVRTRLLSIASHTVLIRGICHIVVPQHIWSSIRVCLFGFSFFVNVNIMRQTCLLSRLGSKYSYVCVYGVCGH